MHTGIHTYIHTHVYTVRQMRKRSEVRSCVSRMVGLGSHSLSNSFPVPNKPLVSVAVKHHEILRAKGTLNRRSEGRLPNQTLRGGEVSLRVWWVFLFTESWYKWESWTCSDTTVLLAILTMRLSFWIWSVLNSDWDCHTMWQYCYMSHCAMIVEWADYFNFLLAQTSCSGCAAHSTLATNELPTFSSRQLILNHFLNCSVWFHLSDNQLVPYHLSTW